ncbi:Unknown protein [Striga hermonthica]|uniref:F-box domain-containing protein n=1 Tax=Striga hermonthica TaxID=68872 RepID=A0A9N7R9S6_STRHE|nr:Unknown protein [Striga hermonthica]
MMMAARGEFFLSEPIIHRIQSFLNGREAAQTTVLSKSWRQAWLTRPNLDFDTSHFSTLVEFPEFMDKTIRSLEIRESRQPCCFVVPAEVFGCRDLVELSLNGGKIGFAPEHQVQFPRLKALSLSDVGLESDEVISGYFWAAPCSKNCHSHSKHSFNYDVWDFNGLTLHQVEELTIDVMDCDMPSLTSFAIFDGLFRLCRPKFITQQNQTLDAPRDFLFKTFLRHEISHECSARSLGMYGLRHLEEVRAQIFYADVYTWWLITWDTWDALKDKKKIRFQLKWRDESQQVN